jgi:hypothetical protein
MFTRGGQRVAKGTYWDMGTGVRVDLAEEGILPGTEKSMYIKAPSALVLLAGPALGLLFAVFLPFIGIAMTAALVARKIGEVAVSAAARSVSFGWRPIEAYLAGKKGGKGARKKKGEKK